MTTLKTLAFFADKKEDYLIEDGMELKAGNTVKASMIQSLTGTDWYMESFGLTVSFSLYGDLLGISKWAMDNLKDCKKDGTCMTDNDKAEISEQVEKSNENMVDPGVDASPFGADSLKVEGEDETPESAVISDTADTQDEGDLMNAETDGSLIF